MIDPRLEAEYNNRAKVPEHPAIIEGWARDAAAFRTAHPHAELDLPYGAGARERMDVFWPDASRAGPVALFIHGGYWAALDRSLFSHLARGLLAHGYAVAIPSYDLCPTVTIDQIVSQMQSAAAMLARRTGRPVLASGHSAGGHLAAMLLATDWPRRGDPADTIAAAAPISGLFDLRPLILTSINAPLRLDEPTAARLSPVDLPSPSRPLHAFVGALEGEEYLGQSSRIAARWNGTMTVTDGDNHFTIVSHLSEPGSSMTQAIAGLGRSGVR